MSRQARQLRRQPQRAPRHELLVFTEGEVTEVQYLKELERRHRDKVVITIDHRRGVPLTLVEHAAKARERDLKLQRKQRGTARDEYWCVFDHDDHPNIPAALELARNNSIEVAFSNPCMELWLLLHDRDQTAYIERHEVQREWRELSGCEGKHLSSDALDLLNENYAAARGRAQHLDEKHRLDGSPERENPSSSVWRLVQTVLDHS